MKMLYDHGPLQSVENSDYELVIPPQNASLREPQSNSVRKRQTAQTQVVSQAPVVELGKRGPGSRPDSAISSKKKEDIRV